MRHLQLGMLLIAILAMTPWRPVAAAGDAVQRLQAGERLTCMPAYKVFCFNIHVSCAGRSRQATAPLSLEIGEAGARLGTALAETAAEPGKPFFDENGGYVLVRFPPDNDYFKVEADGRYSHRIYRHGRALMSRGKCG